MYTINEEEAAISSSVQKKKKVLRNKKSVFDRLTPVNLGWGSLIKTRK
jgi:hypothetical protein